jgi:hypothetical protein
MAKAKGYKGISFPFRIGGRGGVVMSSTSRNDVSHIEESMEQILRTRVGERVMEEYFGSDLDTQIFESNSPPTHNMIRYQIKEALDRFEDRIRVDRSDIEVYGEGNKIYAKINYFVEKYNVSKTSEFYIGGRER